MDGEVIPTIQTIAIMLGDRFLLCTDGLTAMVPDQQIAHILRTAVDPKITTQTLIQAANKTGGRDNMTALVIDCLQETNSP